MSKIQKKERQVNIEILRILSMFLIVLGHCWFHGFKSHGYEDVFDVSSTLGIFNYISMELLWIISTIGVNCFVFITGYFMVNKFELRWKGLMNLWIQILFYSLGLYVLLNGSVSPGELFTYSLPIYSSPYWFITKYFALMLLAPFLSILAHKITQKQYVLLLIILFILFGGYTYGPIFAGCYTLSWFVFLYMIAGYYRLYGFGTKISRHAGIIVFLLLVVLFLLATCINLYHLYRDGNPVFRIMSTAGDGIAFFLSLAVFVWFSKLTMKATFFHHLSKVAPYTLGVYLIHEHPLIRVTLWDNILPESLPMPMIFYVLSISLAIFITTIAIDYLRSRLFGLLRLDRLSSKFEERMHSFTK